MQTLNRFHIAFLLLPALASLGANWYVAPAPAGSNSNDCTQSSPCATVAHGVSKMNDGDTLYLADGTYATGAVSGGVGCIRNGTTHIALRKTQSCRQNGCTIRAENVTSPPSVTLKNASMGIANNQAHNWTFEGIEIISKTGISQCNADDMTYRNMRFVYTQNATVHYFWGGSRVLLDHVETYREGKPCEIYTLATPYNGIGLTRVKDVTIVDSYLGFVMHLANMDGVDGFTLKRSQVEHWGGHGFTMLNSTRNVLFENNIIGGIARCKDSDMHGPRLFDIYEGKNVTVRNNTVVGHGYSPRSTAISYNMFINTNAGCTLSSSEPGFCEYDTAKVCTKNDIPKIPGVRYSTSSSQCPARNDGSPWSPNQRCSGVCDHENIKFYNNLIYDLRDTGVPEAGTRYIDWQAKGIWSTSENLRLDGNYYSEGVVRWICGDGGGNKLSMADWRAAPCQGGPNPDPHSIVGTCSATTSQVCGTDSDCPSSQTCVPRPPAFVNYVGGDYRPAASDAIQVNAGVGGVDADGVARCASDDHAGNPRSDGFCDIGAYELHGGGTGPPPVDPPDDPPSDPPGDVRNPRRTDTTGSD